MEQVILVIHLILAVSLIALVLLQESEGGGLGIGGGGGGMGDFMSVRGTANFLTRATIFMAAGFMITSVLLSILAGSRTAPTSILDLIPGTVQDEAVITEDDMAPAADLPADLIESLPETIPSVPISE